ncbi:hypothetical protein ACYY36_005217, partial [Escherichia coli]
MSLVLCFLLISLFFMYSFVLSR